MERTNDLEKTAIYGRAVTIPELRAEIAGLWASKARLSDEGIKLRFEIDMLKAKNAELRDRNSTYLLRLKQEEQCREGWQERAEQAEAELALVRR